MSLFLLTAFVLALASLRPAAAFSALHRNEIAPTFPSHPLVVGARRSGWTDTRHRIRTISQMAGGEGGDTEWAKALYEASGDAVGNFEKDMKMKGLMKGNTSTNPKLTANQNLIQWLSTEGNVYLSETSSWGEAPHPLAISTETKDEITNESSGRGLLARRDINDGDELLKIPIKLCLTKEAAQEALGIDVVEPGMNEYLAMALHLIHEKFVQKDQSFWKRYLDVLPEANEVSPTFMWSDADLDFLQGSPVIAATKSLQNKVPHRKSLYYDFVFNDHLTLFLLGFFPTKPSIHSYDENTMPCWEDLQA